MLTLILIQWASYRKKISQQINKHAHAPICSKIVFKNSLQSHLLVLQFNGAKPSQNLSPNTANRVTQIMATWDHWKSSVSKKSNMTETCHCSKLKYFIRIIMRQTTVCISVVFRLMLVHVFCGRLVMFSIEWLWTCESECKRMTSTLLQIVLQRVTNRSVHAPWSLR